MKRYHYSFYYAEGPFKGDLIITVSFVACSFFDAEFMSQCYCYVLSGESIPYRCVYCKFLKCSKI